MSAAGVAAGLVLAIFITFAALGVPEVVRSRYMRRQSEPAAANREPSPAEILAQQLERTPASAVHARLTLHTSLGHLLRDQGRYTDAVKHYAQAEGIAPGAAERSLVLRRRGLAELALGRLAAAEQSLRTALALSGQEGEGAAEALHGLGDVAAEQGKLADAIEVYKRAQYIAVLHGDADEAVLLLADIAEASNRAGRTDEAARWLRRASEELEADRRGEARPLPLVAAKVNSYWASAHHNLGDVAKAASLYKKAMQVQAAALRPSHPDLLATRIGLARTQRDLGDIAGARQAVEAIERTLRAGPNEGPDLSRVLILKADMLRFDGEYGLAQIAMEDAIRLQDQWFQGADHPETAVALAGYGSILHDAGQLGEAKSRYEEALAMTLKTVGEIHPETAAVYNSLGTLFQDMHEPILSFSRFAKCLDIQRATVGEGSPDVANTYNNMATVLFQQGRSTEAAELLRKAVGILDASGVPQGSPDRALYEENLGAVVKSLQEGDNTVAREPQVQLPTIWAFA